MLKELMLAPPPLTLAVAESFTGGRLQALMTEISGASDFFRGGLTAYTLEAKVRHLGVDRVPAEAMNGVSAAVARQMAQGAAALFGADIGLATTGYAEPAPARGVGVPSGHWALCHRLTDHSIIWREGVIELPGRSRVEVQASAAAAVRAALVDHLREWRGRAAP